MSNTVINVLLRRAESSSELQVNKPHCWEVRWPAGLEITQRADKETACKPLTLAKILLLQNVSQKALTELHTTYPKCM